ncbi:MULTISPECIES: antibiotic biosynthesis monooxygenase [unclassified Streptomyces]|uniref:Antibiotic biosynthesis monooxygenase n=1 Tax=Streptomyces sp. NBC_00119 TaxID=2975659 RepID=A0AAU1U269_9ACTN|nr:MULTISPECIES: antibiotic biosynthesis monooxygenase [unclassified Streptomyces]MCX5435613.1 antibiotic biosynthesis monooxygenase [Streptomyces sp. NBC_00063]WSE08854.1 antibiotic biosynthesis monooxygenase [Streptomyces sp. NBC_01445]WSE13410.1 antibiotic biosynthesis monooxygenase [Streptomyces sp. NBC_01397]WUB97673.1 antibiotic biosynthesis monooxygenase [Streptomyces sp. NBC_00569]
MIYEHAELHVHPRGGVRLETDFAAVRHLLLEAPGCRSAELLRSVDHPDTYLLRVGWERLEDHTDVFPGTPQAKAFAEAVAPHCVARPRVVHYAAQGDSTTAA